MAGTFTINDLGGRAFTHPVVDAPLHEEYTLEEIRDSADLRAAIQAGDFTATFDGVAITTDALFDEYLVDFDHKQVKQNTDDIAALTGSKTWAYTFGEDKRIKGDRYLKASNNVFSNLSPYIVPLACNLYAVSVKSNDGTAISYDVIVEDDTDDQKKIKDASKKYMIFYRNLTPIVYTSVKDFGVNLTMRFLCDPRQRRGYEQTIWEAILSEFGKCDDIDFAYPTQRFYNNITEGKPGANPSTPAS